MPTSRTVVNPDSSIFFALVTDSSTIWDAVFFENVERFAVVVARLQRGCGNR